jgi:enoyl-CoA hydratase
MPLENVLYELKDSVAYITVNRPDKLNALNSRTMAELMDVFSLASVDPQVKAVILTGAGEKAFVAGADISEFAEMDPLGAKRFAERGQEIFNFIESMPKPVIAAVNGFALGGGCELAMACHIRIASENAKFGQPEVKLGLIPGYGGTQRLPRLVGKGRALEMILSGEMIDANEAYRIGLANRVVLYAGYKEVDRDGVKKKIPDMTATKEALMEEVLKVVKSITAQSPLAVTFALEAVNRGLQLGLLEGQAMECNLFGLVSASDDFLEGTSAFLDKRSPMWSGK